MDRTGSFDGQGQKTRRQQLTYRNRTRPQWAGPAPYLRERLQVL